MIVRIVKWLTLVLLLCYTAIAAVWAKNEHLNDKLRGIEINITNSDGVPQNFITRQGVEAEIASLRSGIGHTRLGNINLEKLERRLSLNNNYEQVECTLSSGGTLRIEIVPMIPELRVFNGNTSYYINKDGKQINSDLGFHANLPVVSGRFNSRFPASKLLPLVRYIESDSVLKNIVAMIKVQSPTDILLIPRIKGHVINLGDMNNLKEKFENILLAYHKIMPHKGWDRYDTISVKFRGQIVATLRDKSKRLHALSDSVETDIEEQALQTLLANHPASNDTTTTTH